GLKDHLGLELQVVIRAWREPLETAGKDRERDLKKIFVLPLSVRKHIAIQKETKQEHIASVFHGSHDYFIHLDDARDIWLAVKARFGGNDKSKKMRKSMLKQEFSDFGFIESVAITLKTKGGLDYLSFDDLYNKLRTLEIDCEGWAQIGKLDLEELDINGKWQCLSIRINRFEKKGEDDEV
ncbi:hypothetical protein Tco_0618306, partial [Tanacetum coccineum]